jgi:hypothetical protein
MSKRELTSEEIAQELGVVLQPDEELGAGAMEEFSNSLGEDVPDDKQPIN